MADKKTETALVKAADAALALPLNADTVRRYLCANATDQEVTLFLNQCVMFGLNPFKREIYLIKYGTSAATHVVGYESYLKRADRTHQWAGMESGTVDDKDGHPVKAWARVYRKDWGERSLYHEVDFSEYCQYADIWENGRKTGKRPTKFWADKPKTMLKKVAVAQAFRMAFPDEMGGMPYIAEERVAELEKLPTAEVTARVETKPEAKTLKPGAPDEFGAPAPRSPAPAKAPETAPQPPRTAVSAPGPDLTDPKVNPFEKPQDLPSDTEPETKDAEVIEGLEREHMEDEPGSDLADMAHHDTPERAAEKMAESPETAPEQTAHPICTPDQVQKIALHVSQLVALKLDEQLVWRCIVKKAQENFGHAFTDTNDLTADEAKRIIDYLHRWVKAEEKAQLAKMAAAKTAGGAK
jgi:phage recombination protein Bet